MQDAPVGAANPAGRAALPDAQGPPLRQGHQRPRQAVLGAGRKATHRLDIASEPQSRKLPQVRSRAKFAVEAARLRALRRPLRDAFFGRASSARSAVSSLSPAPRSPTETDVRRINLPNSSSVLPGGAALAQASAGRVPRGRAVCSSKQLKRSAAFVPRAPQRRQERGGIR